MKRLVPARTVTRQIRDLGIGEEMEILFTEKYPHLVKAIARKLSNENMGFEIHLTDNSTIIKKLF